MIVVGAALQGIGLGFVFYEVIAIRVHEFGGAAWPTRTIHWGRATSTAADAHARRTCPRGNAPRIGQRREAQLRTARPRRKRRRAVRMA